MLLARMYAHSICLYIQTDVIIVEFCVILSIRHPVLTLAFDIFQSVRLCTQFYILSPHGISKCYMLTVSFIYTVCIPPANSLS